MESPYSNVVTPAAGAPVASPPAACAPVAVPRPSKSFTLALLVLALAIGALLKFLGPRPVQDLFDAIQLTNLGAVAALFAALVAAVLLHESGHLIASLLMNFELVGVCVGPLRLVRSYGQWKVQSSGRWMIASVSAIPRNVNNWRPSMLIVVASGQFMTFIMGLFAAWLFAHPRYGHPAWTNTFVAAFVQLSAFFFVLGLVPNSRTSPVRNDARLFLLLLTDTPEAREILLYHVVTRLDLDGTRPRDYPAPLIRALAAARTRPELMLVYAHLVSSWALDRGDLANADVWDQYAVQLSAACSDIARQTTLARSACLDLTLREDAVAAARKLAQLDLHSLRPAWLQHRAMAALLLTKGAVSEALAEIASAQYAFPTRSSYFEFERMLLVHLHRKALAFEPPDPSLRCSQHAA